MSLRTLQVLAVALLLAVFAGATPAVAQVFTGRIDVTVEDATGARLPGVTVQITGPVNHSAVTDGRGEAHFLSLTPGTYQLQATISGFNEYKNTSIPIQAGVSVPLGIKMTVAGTQETVQVTAETPVIDTKKSGTATSVSLDELQNIPSARDPWVVMQTVPGVIMDRVNVGGSESGQQSGYLAKGATSGDSTWNMDGVPVTDMSALGGSPSYYDFDMFQEMNVTTGGSDMGSSTGGVHLNMVLKSGSNAWRGSSRLYFEDKSMQGTNMDPALAKNLGSPNGQGNRTNQYMDYGFEVGGPLLKDRLWAWGSLAKTDVRILTIRQTPDRTLLKNRAFKTQGQLSNNLRASFTYFFGDKNKFGRSASAQRPPETTLDQKGPGSFIKGEVNYTVGNNLFLTGRVSHYKNGFSFTPEGGMNADVYRDDSRTWHGSYWNYLTDRPQDTVMADGSLFRGRHEVKFGFSYRRVTVTSSSELPTKSGQHIATYYDGYPNMFVDIVSPWASAARALYASFYVGDTITLNRMTINAGVRYDRQSDGTLETSEPAVPGFEKYLPAITAKASPAAVIWNSASPRVSVSYALNESRKTLLRGSYAMFASQMLNGMSNQISPVQYRAVEFYAYDANKNGLADYNEIDQSSVWWWTGFDMNNPGSLTTLNKIGDYKVPKTHEWIAGVDHELMQNFGISAAFTYRRMVDFNWYPRIGVTRAAYVQAGALSGALPNGTTYNVPYYKLDPAKVADIDAAQGTTLTGQNGYHQRFIGLELSATKRMSNRWMARFAFSTNSHTQYYDDPNAAIIDPTPTATQNYMNGGQVVYEPTSSGKSGFYMVMPKYQGSANAMYQIGYGLDVGTNVVWRQGYGQAWYRSSVKTGDYFSNQKTVALYSNIDKDRLPSIATVDVRVGFNPMQALRLKRVGLNIDFDIFNLFNSGTVLKRNYDVAATGVLGANQVLEIMNPRIARVGLRFTF